MWAPEDRLYDLVASLYVHVTGSVEEMVGRLAAGVAPGGTLLLAGHLPIDPVTGAETPAASQVQVTVEAAVAVLDPATLGDSSRREPTESRNGHGLRRRDLRPTPNLTVPAASLG